MNEIIKTAQDILITNRSNKFYISLADIAECTNNVESSVRDYITRKKDDFKTVGFDINNLPLMPNGQKDWSTVLLNEIQTTFLLSLMRNNDIITKFKLGLAIELDRLKQEVENKYIAQIAQLEKIERTTNVYDINGNKFASARGITEMNEEIVAKDFKMELQDSGLIKRELELRPVWKPTKKGIDLGIVIEDKGGTAIYDIEKSVDLYNKIKELEDE